MEHVTNVLLMTHFSRYAAPCHTQKHAYQGWNMYFLCSLAYGFYALDVQFHYCKSIMSLSKFILCWDILQFSGHTHLLLKFYYEIQMLEFQFNYITYTMNQVLYIHLCYFRLSLLSSLWPRNVQSLCKYVLKDITHRNCIKQHVSVVYRTCVLPHAHEYVVSWSLCKIYLCFT